MRIVELNIAALIFLAILFTAMEIQGQSQSQTYYVTQSGGDGNGGDGTLDDPWSVVQFNNPGNWSVIEDVERIDAGDTIFNKKDDFEGIS